MHVRGFNLSDRVYIAKYAEVDGSVKMAALFGITQQCINSVVKRMKISGDYEMYRSLSDDEYEKIVLARERSEPK